MLIKDSKERFSATAGLYARWRPTYPLALGDFLLALIPPTPASGAARLPVIADLGCGTGISTRLLAAPGRRVIGIDPNADMLAEARRTTPPDAAIEYRRREAAATGLPAAGIDLVIAGQAFHWFDLGAAFAEIRRILIPGGFSAAFWNVRDEKHSPLLAEYRVLLERSSIEYDEVAKAEPTIARILAAAAIDDLLRAEFEHAQELDREGFSGRVYSSSYVMHGVPPAARPAFDAELDRLFTRHARDGRVTLRYRTLAIAFRLRRDG
jgi:SAM-dependent methyltransferase